MESTSNCAVSFLSPLPLVLFLNLCISVLSVSQEFTQSFEAIPEILPSRLPQAALKRRYVTSRDVRRNVTATSDACNTRFVLVVSFGGEDGAEAAAGLRWVHGMQHAAAHPGRQHYRQKPRSVAMCGCALQDSHTSGKSLEFLG